MSNYSNAEKQQMLALAKHAIAESFSHAHTSQFPHETSLPEPLKADRACFVTLTKYHKLRGCIGTLMPTLPLYKEIVRNAHAAAFDDPRFPPLTKDEMPEIHIEISVLTVPTVFSYHTKEQLLQHLEKTKPGVILTKHSHRATFLPQVWDDIPDPKIFVQELCHKANLPKDAWEQAAAIELYQVDKIS